MEVGKTFGNISSYNENMSKHMMDKLFWVKYLPEWTNFVFVDFGCADGTMINHLCEMFKGGVHQHTYIGYDISESMIDIAKTNFNAVKNSGDKVFFTSSWKEVCDIMTNPENRYKHKVLILSSLIHEVYSYAAIDAVIEQFWDRVLKSGFDQIMVRDMMLYKDTQRPCSVWLRERFETDANNRLNKGQFESFEKKWGNIYSVKNLIHFLLKYRWKINWERELNENYFPIFIEDFLKIMTEDTDYKLDYFEHFRIPFLENEIKKDFNIELKDNTHIKAVFSFKKH